MNPYFDTLSPFEERIRDFEPMPERTRSNLIRALGRVDQEERAAFLERHAGKGAAWLKYADFVYWTRRHVLQAEDLDLDRSGTLDILDIGTGSGTFAMVAASMGHRVIGTDVRAAWNAEFCKIAGVDLVVAPVRRGEPYRPVDRRFDLVTIMMPNFHRSADLTYWSIGEWAFFLADLAKNLLAETGRVFILLPNDRRPDGRYEEPALVRWAKGRGAIVKPSKRLSATEISFAATSISPRTGT